MSRSQALVDDHLLIDLNGDTFLHFMREGRTLWDVGHLLVTHSHGDHFALEEFHSRFPGIAHGVKDEKMSVYLSKDALAVLETCQGVRGENERGRNARYDFVTVEPYRPFSFDGYTVTPLPAVHAAPETALLYLIEKDGKCLFYGHDTGFFSEEIDDYLAQGGKKIDLLSLDCTKGDNDFHYDTHMSMEEGKVIADRFRSRGLLADDVRLYYNHFSHNAGQTYDELVKRARRYGFFVAYDGLEVTF
ncbi:MAG: MBL fold metallo-hydrolase [Clostridia bacterium]|nr:MBL fold metallo-hydrolase [Clostridia bacterium]